MNDMSTEMMIEKGKTLLQAGDAEGALCIFKSLYKRFPDNGECLFEIGKIHYMRKEYGEAEECLNKAIVAEKGLVHAHILLGKIYAKRDDYGDALQALRAAEKIDPASVHIQAEMGNILLMRSKSEKVKLESGEIQQEIANVLYLQGQFQQDIVYAVSQDAESNGVLYTLRQLSAAFDHMMAKDFLNRSCIDLLILDPLRIAANVQLVLRFARYCNDVGSHKVALVMIKLINQCKGKFSYAINNQILCETNIAEGRSEITSFPVALLVHITTRCNLRCRMCGQDKNIVEEISPHMKKEILSIFPFLSEVTWLGGEVFLYDGFEELMVTAAKYGIKQSITSNGLLIDEHMAQILIENNIILEISIDGATKEIYEYIRRGARSENLLSSINLINQMKKRMDKTYGLKMVVVIMKSNYQQIPDFVQFALSHGFIGIRFVHIQCFRFDDPEDLLSCDYDVRQNIIDMLEEAKLLCHGIEISFYTNITRAFIFSRAFDNQEIPIGLPEGMGPQTHPQDPVDPQINMCFAPWRNASIRYNGAISVMAHCDCGIVVGNLLESGFGEIWNGAKMLRYRTLLLSGDISKICLLVPQYNRVPFELLNDF